MPALGGLFSKCFETTMHKSSRRHTKDFSWRGCLDPASRANAKNISITTTVTGSGSGRAPQCFGFLPGGAGRVPHVFGSAVPGMLLASNGAEVSAVETKHKRAADTEVGGGSCARKRGYDPGRERRLGISTHRIFGIGLYSPEKSPYLGPVGTIDVCRCFAMVPERVTNS